MRILRSPFMGSKSDWLPSRRSVLIHTGGFGDDVRPLAVGEGDRGKAGILAGRVLATWGPGLGDCFDG